MDRSILSLFIFVLVYSLFVLLPARRTALAVSAGILLVITGVISLEEALSSINWNVMGIFIGMGLVTGVFRGSRVPAYVAELIVDRAKNTARAILLICAFAGFISVFVDNVATVLIVAPVALALAKKLGIDPVKIMVGIAVSSNLQGAATLIGDAPSMLLGSFAGMNFMDFFAYKGRPGIFFAVQLGAAASFFVLYGVFHKNREKMKIIPVEKVRSWVPTIILICLIFLLALASFFKTHFSSIPGTICLAMGIMSVAWDIFFGKGSLTENLKSIQWVEVFFLMGIFVLVGSITVTGWTMRISEFLSGIIGNNIFIGYTLIVFVSMFLSAFVDNIPFLVAMIPVAISISAKLHINPSLFLFGLLIGSSLGGNITPIGASANIVSMGLLRKEGYDARFGDFVKIGLPFTLAAVTAAYLFIWFVWKG